LRINAPIVIAGDRKKMDKQELLIALKQTDPTTNLHNV
jgi:hypothetical protein